MGKAKKDRTKRFFDYAKAKFVDEQVQNTIEQHNFNKLIKQGIIVRESLDHR